MNSIHLEFMISVSLFSLVQNIFPMLLKQEAHFFFIFHFPVHTLDPSPFTVHHRNAAIFLLFPFSTTPIPSMSVFTCCCTRLPPTCESLRAFFHEGLWTLNPSTTKLTHKHTHIYVQIHVFLYKCLCVFV